MLTANLNRIFLICLVTSLILGTAVGLILANSSSRSASQRIGPTTDQAKSPQEDNRTFRDFAEGTLQKRPELKDADSYMEGTHTLIRENAPAVTLSSSVLDLSQYEGKKVKVFGETQKALKEGWLMDVGKVETH